MAKIEKINKVYSSRVYSKMAAATKRVSVDTHDTVILVSPVEYTGGERLEKVFTAFSSYSMYAQMRDENEDPVTLLASYQALKKSGNVPDEYLWALIYKDVRDFFSQMTKEQCEFMELGDDNRLVSFSEVTQRVGDELGLLLRGEF